MDATKKSAENFKKFKQGFTVTMLGYPIVISLLAAWLLISGKAQPPGYTLAAWIALAFSGIAIVLHIYANASMPATDGYQPLAGAVGVRFLVRTLGVASMMYVAYPAGCLVVDRLVGLKPMLPTPYNWLGLVLLLPALALEIWTMWTFVADGKGTPVPLEATQKLMTKGPFRYVRNPMVIGSIFITGGLAFILNSYALAFSFVYSFFFYHMHTVKVEEPEMEERFGQAFLDYKARVPRWFPRFRTGE